MNATRSVRPLTAAANGNKNAALSIRKEFPKACIFVNASAFARRCWRPAIHTASTPHVGIPARVLHGNVPQESIVRLNEKVCICLCSLQYYTLPYRPAACLGV